MEAEAGEFEEWEVLHHDSDSDSEPSGGDVAESEESCDFAGDSEGMIQNNYFSLDSQKNDTVGDESEVSSDNPSWIDPGFETQYPRSLSAESWSDKSLGKCLGDSSGISSGIDELGMEEDAILGGGYSEREGGKGVEEKRKISGVVWWKLPIELLRYCAFKGPLWTVSVAAAFMGFLILGRRLYKMKKKSRALGPRITMDHKKISQFMTRGARLNEAISVVKRVPIIRPSLPAVGVTPWPVASLR